MSHLGPLDPLAEVGLAAEQLPRHVAIIMDGNGRWAQQRGLERVAGHRQGAESVRTIVRHCARLGVEVLTLYSFSSENWKRPQDEVDALMRLCALHLIGERDELRENGVRLRQIGRRDALPEDVRRELAVTEALTAKNERLTLCLALNYGSRAEIVDAARQLAQRVADGALRPDAIDEAALAGELYTAGLPDPDLLIRTAGEMRLSNFLLWQLSYAEMHVTPVLWPEFGAEEFNVALRDYGQRVRRFGAVPEAAAPGGS